MTWEMRYTTYRKRERQATHSLTHYTKGTNTMNTMYDTTNNTINNPNFHDEAGAFIDLADIITAFSMPQLVNLERIYAYDPSFHPLATVDEFLYNIFYNTELL